MLEVDPTFFKVKKFRKVIQMPGGGSRFPFSEVVHVSGSLQGCVTEVQAAYISFPRPSRKVAMREAICIHIYLCICMYLC